MATARRIIGSSISQVSLHVSEYTTTRPELADPLRTDDLSEKKETWDAAIRRRICRSSDGVLIPTHIHLWTADNFLCPDNCVKHRQVRTPTLSLSHADECG